MPTTESEEDYKLSDEDRKQYLDYRLSNRFDSCDFHRYSPIFPVFDVSETPEPESTFEHEDPTISFFNGDRRTTSIFFKETHADVVMDEGGGYIYGADQIDPALHPNFRILKHLVDGDSTSAAELLLREPVAMLMLINKDIDTFFEILLESASHSKTLQLTITDFIEKVPEEFRAALLQHFENLESSRRVDDFRRYFQASPVTASGTCSSRTLIDLRRAQQIERLYSLANDASPRTDLPLQAMFTQFVQQPEQETSLTLTETAMFISILEKSCSHDRIFSAIQAYAVLQQQAPTSLVGFGDFFARRVAQLQDDPQFPHQVARNTRKRQILQYLQSLEQHLPFLDAPAQVSLCRLLQSEAGIKLYMDVVKLALPPETTVQFLRELQAESTKSKQSRRQQL